MPKYEIKANPNSCLDDVQATNEETHGPSHEPGSLNESSRSASDAHFMMVSSSADVGHDHSILDCHQDRIHKSYTSIWQDKRNPWTKSKNIQQAGFPDGHPL